ncbi:NADP-dependent oxidoreductase [Sphingomonas oryzagri]
MSEIIDLDGGNRQVHLRTRPGGVPEPDDFRIVTAPLLPPGEGRLLVRHKFIGLSPSALLRMRGESDYGSGMPLDAPVQGQTVGVVCLSNNPDFAIGDHVIVNGGWQQFSVTSGRSAIRVDPAIAPLSAHLGLLGTSGMTAYVGLLDIGQPRSGETVVVSAASGSVGSLVGQIARIKGCRTIGIAGGPEKCAYVVDELGFDACLDHRLPDLPAQLADVCPDGVDVSFENVGGAVRDAVWPLMRDFGRVVLCGMISEYHAAGEGGGPNWFPILNHRLTVRGFLLRDHGHRREAFLRDVSQWYAEGRIRYREDVAHGLERAPEAFIRLVQGQNFGKSVVELTDD